MANSLNLGITITADGSNANATIATLNKNIENVGNASKKAASGVDSISQSAKTLSSAATTAGRALGALGVAVSARQLIQTADAYSGLQSRLKLVSGTANELLTAQTRLFQISQENLTPLAETAQLYSRLATAMREMGRSQADTLAVTDMVGKSMRISGADAASAAAGILQFGQALGSGVLRGDEFNSMMENAPRLAKALADGLKVPISSLRAMAEQGQLTADKVVNAILSQSDAIKREYTQMPVTVSGAFQQIQNALTQYVGEADKGSGASRELAESISLIAKNLNTILDPFAKVVSTMVNGWAKIADSINQVKIALGDLEAYKRQFGVNQALTTEEWNQRRGDGSRYSTGGGFGGSPAFFDGVNRTAGADNGTKILGKALERLGKGERNGAADLVKFLNEYSGTVFNNLTVPWCARYVSAVLNSSGVGGLKTARAKDYENFGASVWKQGMGLDALKNVQPGDIAVFTRKGGGHVGFVKSVDPASGRLGILGGNQSDQVNVTNRSTSGLLAIRRATGDASDIKSAEKAIKEAERIAKAAEAARKKERDDYIRYHTMAIDEMARLDAEKRRQREVANESELKKIEAKIKASGDQFTVDIKAALDQKSFSDQMRIIDAAKTKEEELIRKKYRAASGADSGVADAKAEVAAIDKKIALMTKEADKTREVNELTLKRKTAAEAVNTAEMKAGQNNIELQAALADNAKKYEAMRRDAAEKDQSYQQQLEQNAQSLGEKTAQQQKAIIDSRLKAAEMQVALNEAERQKALEGKTGLEAQQQAQANLNASVQDALNLAALEKQAALDKLAVDQQLLLNEQAMLEAMKATTSERAALAQIESSLAANALAQSQLRLQAMDAEVAAIQKKAQIEAGASKSAKGVEQRVREQQLRENAYWDQYMGRLREYASLWKEITGQVSDSFSESMVAMGEWSKNMDQIHKRYQDNPDMFGNMTPFIEGLEQAQAGLSAMAKTMLAMRSNYAEGTQTYKDLTSAAERMMEVQRSMQVVEGVLAVIHQLTAGDVWSAIPRALGVAAMISSLGVNVNASAKSVQANPVGGSREAGGGVFGDSSAKSDSIASAIKIVADNSTADLAYSAGMLRALNNIEAAMGGVTNSIIRGVGPSPVLGLGVKSVDQIINPMNSISDPITKAIHKLLFNVSKKITDFGIAALPQSLNDILTKGFQGMNFTEITTTTKVLFMTVGKKVKEVYSELNSGVAKQIGLTIRSMADAVKEASKAFGISGKQFDSTMAGFVINFGKFSTAGLKGQELKDAVQQMFSSMSDDMAAYFSGQFSLGLEPFQQAGEGMFETLVRVAEGVNRAKGELETLGLTAISYRKVINTQGDVASEIVRQTLLAQKRLSDGIRQYVNELVGSSEDIIAAYKQLIEASNLLKTAGVGDKNLDRTMINAAGGLDAFNAAMQSFNDNFLSEADRYAGDVRVLSEQFGKLGYTLPSSKEGFLALVQGIDTSTEAGKKLFGQMISLSEAFAKVADEAQAIRDKYASILNPFKQYADQIKAVGTDFGKLIEGAASGSQAQLDAIKNAASDARDPMKSRQNNLLKRIKNRFGSVEEMDSQLAEWQAQLDAELAKPKNKRNTTLIAALRDKLDRFTDLSDRLNDINQKLLDLNAKEGVDTVAEIARAAAEKQGIIEDARTAMASTLEDVFNSIIQAVEQAQQRLKSVIDVQKSLASQLAQLGGNGAMVDLAQAGYNDTRKKIVDYIRGIRGGAKGDTTIEVALLQEAQQAVMDKYNAELAAIQETEKAQIDAATNFKSALEGIAAYAKSLRLSPLANLSPQAKLEESQRQYQDLLTRSRAGDVDAIGKLTGASDAYLEAAKSYYGSSTQYQDIFTGVQNAMESLSGLTAADPDSVQGRIDALKEAAIADLQGLQRLAELSRQEAQRQADEAKRVAQENAERALNLAQDQLAALDASAKLNRDQVLALNAILANAGLNPVDVTPYAAGGFAQAGMALVGEKGPELVRFERPAQVMTADQTRSALNGDNPKTYQALEDIKTELKAIVTTQSGANPQIINKLDQLEQRLSTMERNQRLSA